MDQSEAYAFLYKLAEGISIMFGKNCETIIHEIDGQRIRNLAIFNGHVTNRKAGSTLSIYGKDTTRDDASGQNLSLDYFNQQVIANGRQIKSTTVHMRGADYHYALGINYDVTVLKQMSGILDNLTAMDGELRTRMENEPPEMEELFSSTLAQIDCPLELMHKSDRLNLVRLLQDKGVFRLRCSVPYVAKRLNVSKFTIYNYLNEISEG